MTYSVLSIDPISGAIGAAAATGNLGVGGWVLRAAADGGAVATQGLSVSSLWGDDALALLRNGLSAQTAMATVVGPDSGRQGRQLAVLDRRGAAAAFTGQENTDTTGQIVGPGYVIAGNWLASAATLTEMERQLQAPRRNRSFGSLLVDVLAAGSRAGGDSRGCMSAALRIVHPASPPLDLRIDIADDPIEELRKLHTLASGPPYSAWAECVPSLRDPFRC